MTKELICEQFVQKFGAEPEFLAFAPGRVNLIGEHLDYNGGHVLPCALNLGTYGALRRRRDRRLRLFSQNYRGLGTIDLDLDDLSYDLRDNWTNYIKAMIWIFAEQGLALEHGFELFIEGTIPNGSGLSSSASIELLMGVFLRALCQAPEIDLTELALWAQAAENQFIGVRCGIMDQFAVARGRKGQAMLLDTVNLETAYYPLETGEYSLLIINSNKKRGLAGSAYNERRQQCERALADLRHSRAGLRALCSLKEEEFAELAGSIQDPAAYKRARHAVTEEARTLAATEALKAQNLLGFGELMKASHCSLRDDFEVTGAELDALVEAAWRQESCLGARMTGAGFGGCTVNLVRTGALADFCQTVQAQYEHETGLKADFYPVEAGAGAALLAL